MKDVETEVETKYPLPPEPAYKGLVEKRVQKMDPPDFSTQGEAAGRKRGRKPRGVAKAKAKAKGKAAARKTKATARPKSGARSKTKKDQEVAPKPRGNKKGPKSLVSSSGSKQSPKRKGATGSGAGSSNERVPPSHVTHNHIYSSAYRKAMGQCPNDVEFARRQGKAAIELFKLKGIVNHLCGEFRPHPRASKVQV